MLIMDKSAYRQSPNICGPEVSGPLELVANITTYHLQVENFVDTI